MKLTSFETIVRTLNGANVRYLVVGGVAVNAYGYGRSTYDVDMVLSLDSENISRAFAVLKESGYEPIVPVTAEQFMDRETRERWHSEKGMIFLQMCGDLHRDTPLDIFVREPFDFAEEYAAAIWQELAPGVQVPLVRL